MLARYIKSKVILMNIKVFTCKKPVNSQVQNCQKLILINILLFWCFFSFAGCVSYIINDDFFSSEDRVLYQTGEAVAEYSSISVDEWQEIALSSEHSIAKVYGILVVYGAEKANQAARSYILKNPKDIRGYEALARSLYSQKRLYLALYYANYVLSLDKSRVGMYNLIGLIKMYQAKTAYDFRNAELYFDRLLDDSEYSVVAMTNLGFMYLEIDALLRAEKIFTRLKQDCDECSPALLGLGITSRRLNKKQQALGYFYKALKKRLSTRTKLKFYYNIALVLKDDPETIIKASEYLSSIIEKSNEKQEIYNRSLSLLNEIKLNINSSS